MCAEDQTPNYDLLAERLASFHNQSGVVDPSKLALCGFFYRGFEDVCVCFECKIELHQWEINECPLDDHLKYSPNCEYAKFIAFLKTCGKQMLQQTIDERKRQAKNKKVKQPSKKVKIANVTVILKYFV